MHQDSYRFLGQPNATHSYIPQNEINRHSDQGIGKDKLPNFK